MKKLLLLFALALGLSVMVIGLSIYDELRRTASDDPGAWASAIEDFEAEDTASPPPADAILFVGSSSIRLWHTLAQDMDPLVTIRRGFGGARMHDMLHYADRIITRYDPAQVVIFVGTNDINASDQPWTVVSVISDGLAELIERILSHRPDSQVYYVAITPSIFAWDKREAVFAANAAARKVCERYDNATFIDTRDLFLTDEGLPDKRLFQFDGLHLSAEGYQRWTARIKPLLTAAARRADSEASD